MKQYLCLTTCETRLRRGKHGQPIFRVAISGTGRTEYTMSGFLYKCGTSQFLKAHKEVPSENEESTPVSYHSDFSPSPARVQCA